MPVIDALAVYWDAVGEIEVEHLSDLSTDETVELGSKAGRADRMMSVEPVRA